jgi:hypothetical protein
LEIGLDEVVLPFRDIPCLDVVGDIVPIPDPARGDALQKLQLLPTVPTLLEDRRTRGEDKIELVIESMRIRNKTNSQTRKALTEQTAASAPNVNVTPKVAATGRTLEWIVRARVVSLRFGHIG